MLQAKTFSYSAQLCRGLPSGFQPLELYCSVVRQVGPRWIVSKASVGTGLGPSWSKTLFLFITTYKSSNKWQTMSKPGPGCGCLLSARLRWSQTPRPNSPLMTSDESSDAHACISVINYELFMLLSIIPACNSEYVMACACSGFKSIKQP